jgi:branched-chain amino acid transport system substrate-binding protein
VKNAIESIGKKWMLVTNDYVWGHNTAAATRKLVEAYGGEIVDEILVPQGTRDFSSTLLSVQQAGVDVVGAAVGGDDQKAMRQQVAQLGLGDSPAWINNQQDWPDVYGLPIDNLFGVFGTTWYYKLDLPGVAEFVRRYQAMYPDTKMRVPGNVFYNGYMATKELLSAVERAGTTSNIAVIKQLEGHKMPASERMQHHDAWIDPDTHQVQQTVYLATANKGSADADDMFKVLSWTDPAAVKDDGAPGACKLESYAETPTYEV